MTIRQFLRWLWPPIPKADHNHNWRIAPDLCEPYQPVYRCTICGDPYMPPNR